MRGIRLSQGYVNNIMSGKASLIVTDVAPPEDWVEGEMYLLSGSTALAKVTTSKPGGPYRGSNVQLVMSDLHQIEEDDWLYGEEVYTFVVMGMENFAVPIDTKNAEGFWITEVEIDILESKEIVDEELLIKQLENEDLQRVYMMKKIELVDAMRRRVDRVRTP